MTMMRTMLQAGLRLEEALRAENEALARLDMTRAAALATVKVQASDAFAAATTAAGRGGARPDGEERERAQGLAGNLRDLAAENRRLLERAIALQSRIIETIAGAAIPASRPTTYGDAGQRAMPRQAPALAMTTRA